MAPKLTPEATTLGASIKPPRRPSSTENTGVVKKQSSADQKKRESSSQSSKERTAVWQRKTPKQVCTLMQLCIVQLKACIPVMWSSKSIWYSSTFLQVLGILAIVEKYSDDKILVLFIEYSDSDTKVILLIRDLKYLVTRTF